MVSNLKSFVQRASKRIRTIITPEKNRRERGERERERERERD